MREAKMLYAYRPIFTNFIAILLFVAACSLWQAGPASAQVSIQLGLSNAKVIRELSRKGYDQIEIYDRGMTSVWARACKGGIRYRVRINLRMKLSGIDEIGQCRRLLSVEEAQVMLRDLGYRRINVEDQNGFYVAVACNRGVRTRVKMSHFGEIRNQKNIGRCKDELEPTDVATLLRQQGYNRIDFTDRQLPKYVAEACLNNERLKLELNRFGKLRRQTRIGRCDPPIDPTKLYAVLRDKGYNRIQILDDQLPRYVAQACRGNNQVKVTLNRYGRVTDETRIGNCASAVTVQQVEKLLNDNGFTRVHVQVNGVGAFEINACLEGQKKIIKLSRYGELVDEVDDGACVTRSFREVRDALRNGGMRGVKFYVEACRKKRRIRIHLNEFGERIGRERIGKC